MSTDFAFSEAQPPIIQPVQIVGYQRIERGIGRDTFCRTPVVRIPKVKPCFRCRYGAEYPAGNMERLRPTGIAVKLKRASLLKGHGKPKTPSLADLLISYYQDRNAGAWSQKAKGKNLKEFAEAVNYLMENKLLTLEALESRLSAVSTEFDTLSDTMKAKSARMKELQELIRQAENYKRLKPVYDELNGIKWKKQREKFETAHDADLRLFYTARRILKEKLDRKPITLAAWKQEYDRLQAEYAKLSPQYKPLREDLMKMRRVQYCVDRVLQRRQPEQEAPKKKQDIEL